MDKMKILGFIFDLDGVITDSAEFHFQAWKRLADEEGIPFTREDNEALRGIPRRQSLLALLKGKIYPEDKLLEMMDRKNRYYQDLIAGITPEDLLPGAKDLLIEIRIAGYKAALGSASKNAREVIARLGIESLFDAIADGYSVEKQKPAPDLFLHAAAQLGLSPEQCLVVEDAAAGIDAAKAGGFFAVGLGDANRLAQADVVFPNLRGVHLNNLLKALGIEKEE
jgi:beta-phosphoglucomutase